MFSIDYIIEAIEKDESYLSLPRVHDRHIYQEYLEFINSLRRIIVS